MTLRAVCVVCAFCAVRAVCVGAGLALPCAVTAQPYPSKIIRVINPAAPGGNSDLFFRVLSPKMNEALGQPLVMDYRPGAGATVGTEAVARSAPDGYTVLITAASHVTNPALVKKLPYDAIKDFSALGLIADVPLALVTHPSLPAQTVKALIALGHAHPGKVNYSSGGRGTVGHLAGALFGAMAKAQFTFVPYKGSHQALVDVMAGHVQFQFSSISNLLPYVQNGRLRLLAQGGEKRSSSSPGTPTLNESALPGFVVRSGFSLLGPTGMPPAIVEKLNSALVKALNDADNRKLLISRGADPVGNSPAEHAVYLRNEIDKWIKVVREAGIITE